MSAIEISAENHISTSPLINAKTKKKNLKKYTDIENSWKEEELPPY